MDDITNFMSNPVKFVQELLFNNGKPTESDRTTITFDSVPNGTQYPVKFNDEPESTRRTPMLTGNPNPPVSGILFNSN